MIIAFNTDHNIDGGNKFTAPLATILLERFEKYSHKIKKMEVHLSDENGNKKGVDDKRCLLEAHIDGMEPVVCTNHAGTFEESLSGAIHNLKASLDKKLGRAEEHNRTIS